MKDPYTQMLSTTTRFIQSLLIIFIFSIPNLTKGQTLFDIAVELDSLYDKLGKKDTTAAAPFFDALRTAANLDADYSAQQINKDLALNRFLHNKVELALSELGVFNDEQQENLSKLKAQQDDLAQAAINLMKASCINCDYFLSLIDYYDAQPQLLYSDVNDGRVSMLITNPGTINSLQKINRDFNFLESEIEKIEQPSSAPVIQQEQALSSIPLEITSTSSSVAPIIIQNQVGGSAQSAIIDGASKWIAERMRQELSIAFFDRFESWAEKENINTLFPNTLYVLKSSANTDYTLMMEIFKRAFGKDLNQLTFNLPAFLEKELVHTDKSEQLFNDIMLYSHQLDSIEYLSYKEYSNYMAEYNYYPLRANLTDYMEQGDSTLSKISENALNELSYNYFDRGRDSISSEYEKSFILSQSNFEKETTFKYLMFSLEAINQLQAGSHPSSLINHLYANVDELFPGNVDLKSILLLLHVLSESLIATDVEQNTVWIGKEQLQRLRTDVQLGNIYFGLIDYKVKSLFTSEKLLLERQKNEALRSIEKDSIRNMIVNQGFIFSDFLDYAQSALVKNMQDSIHPLILWEQILEDYTPPSYLASHYDQSQAIKRYGSILHNLQHDKILMDYLVLSNQLAIETESNFNHIESIINKITGLGLSDFRLHEILVDQGVHFERFFEFYESPSSYTYLQGNINTLQNAKSAFFNEYSKEIAYTYRILQNPTFNRPILDSIINVRIEDQYNLYKFCQDNDFDPITRKSEYLEGNYALNIESDSLKMIFDFRSQNLLFRNLEMKTHSLYDQERFLNNFLHEENQTTFGNFFNQFIQFTNKIDQINTEFSALKATGDANLGNQEFIYLIKNSVDIIDLILDFSIDKENQDVVDMVEMAQFATNNLLDAYVASLNEDYNGIVMNIIPVVERLVENKYSRQILPLEQALSETITPAEFGMGLLPPSRVLDSLRLLRDNKLRKMREIFKYCTFLAAVAESNNSDDVKTAINAIALPVGSYSIKRRTFRNISLNAYPGVTFGAELVKKEWAFNFGFTAPIGVAYSWGYRSKINQNKYDNNFSYRNRVQKAELGMDDRFFNGHSGSVFVSIIDLGALVLFRLDNSSESLPEDVSFRQILSPGIMYAHGLGKVPISIMGGIQMTPGLRVVGEDIRANSLRFNISLVVDIPIANFHTRR